MLALTHRIAALNGSMDELKDMHRDLAGLIKAEAKALTADLGVQLRAA